MWTIMNLKWASITFVATYVMGVIGGIGFVKFLEAYQEARDAGVIA